jgi:hypothetical protein
MADDVDPTPDAVEPAPAPEGETVEQAAVTNEATPAVADKQKFTDRLWNFRAMVAVALAALLLGGGVGAAIAAISHDGDDRDHRFARFGDGPGPFMGPGGPGGFGPGDRQQFRDDLKKMRQDMRDQMKKRLDQEVPTPTPSPSATPNG